MSDELGDARTRDFDATVGPWIEPGYRLAVAMLRDPEEAHIDNAMKKLAPDDRGILHLHYFLDLPIEEVAVVLGITPGAAKTRVHRAAHRLRPKLELMEEDLR